MSRALPDALSRDRAEALYLLGLTPVDIAKRLDLQGDTVRQWVTRGKWKKKKDTRHDAVLAVIQGSAEEIAAAAIKAQESRAAKVYEAQLDRLSQFQAVEAKEFVDVANALEKLDLVARRTLKMESVDASKQQIRVDFYAKGFNPVAPVTGPTLKQAQVVDVQSVADTSGE